MNLALCLNGKNGKRYDGESESFVVSRPLKAGGNLRHDESHDTYVTHALSSEGADASEDGTGRGTPLVPFTFDPRQVTSKENRTTVSIDGPCGSLHEMAQAVAYRTSGNCGVMEQGDKTAALNCATDPNQNIIVGGFKRGQGAKARTDGYQVEQSPTLTASDSGTQQSPGVHIGMAVRRLTPRECERLQGFDDDWTRYGVTGNVQAEISDSARYRMLGNAVNRKVSQFLGGRIVATARPAAEIDEQGT